MPSILSQKMVHIININDLELKCKIWFEDPSGDQSLLGENKFELLSAIHELGSIKGAAEKCGIEYKTAWDMIHTINARFEPNQVIVSERGQNGGSSLTTLGIELMGKYNRIIKTMNEVLALLNEGKEISISVK